MSDNPSMKLRVVKHIPSSREYVPADILEVEAVIPQGGSLRDAFERLNEETLLMIQRWKNPDSLSEKPRETPQQPRQSITAPNKPVTPPPAKPQASGDASAEQKALESLKWIKFKDGNGEWAFYLSAAGDLLRELEPIKGLIEKMKGDEKLQVSVGKFTYKIKGRFLNRFPSK